MCSSNEDLCKEALHQLSSGDDETVLAGINSLVEVASADAEALAAADATAAADADSNAEAIARCLNCSSKKIRMSATWALGKIKTSISVHALTDLLEQESDPFLRATAAIALGDTQQPEAMPILEILLKDKIPRVRANAVESIAKVGDPSSVSLLLPLLEDPNNRVKANVAMVLWKFGGLRMVSELHKMLKTSYDDKWLRASAAWALGEIGGFGTVETLVAVLNDKAPEVRRYIIKALGKIGDVSAIEKIVPFLEDEDPLVRANTVEALGALTAHDEAGVLIEKLGGEADPLVVAKAGSALDRMVAADIPGMLEKLLKAILVAEHPLKRIIIATLGNRGTNSILPGLVNISRDDSSRMIKYAARKAALTIRKRGTLSEKEEEDDELQGSEKIEGTA